MIGVEDKGYRGGSVMATIGEKIRYYREKAGFTAKLLAEKIGMSPSTISKIENNKNDPSLDLLQKISSALDVPMGQLFIEEEKNGTAVENGVQVQVVRKDERKIIILPNSDIEYRLLSPSFQGRSELALMEINPGQSSGEHKSHPGGEEITFVLEGELRITIDSVEYVLQEGDSITFDSKLDHYYENASDKKTVVISGNTPPIF